MAWGEKKICCLLWLKQSGKNFSLRRVTQWVGLFPTLSRITIVTKAQESDPQSVAGLFQINLIIEVRSEQKSLYPGIVDFIHQSSSNKKITPLKYIEWHLVIRFVRENKDLCFQLKLCENKK